MMYRLLNEDGWPDFVKGVYQTDKQQAEILGTVIITLSKAGKTLNNKAIILALLAAMEEINDESQLTLFRNALELVVENTPDDAEY